MARRCATVTGVAGVVLEGVAMLAIVLLWVALQELGKAFEGADAMPAWQVPT